jgi:hypothetical protein
VLLGRGSAVVRGLRFEHAPSVYPSSLAGSNSALPG